MGSLLVTCSAALHFPFRFLYHRNKISPWFSHELKRNLYQENWWDTCITIWNSLFNMWFKA